MLIVFQYIEGLDMAFNAVVLVLWMHSLFSLGRRDELIRMHKVLAWIVLISGRYCIGCLGLLAHLRICRAAGQFDTFIAEGRHDTHSGRKTEYVQ